MQQCPELSAATHEFALSLCIRKQGDEEKHLYSLKLSSVSVTLIRRGWMHMNGLIYIHSGRNMVVMLTVTMAELNISVWCIVFPASWSRCCSPGRIYELQKCKYQLVIVVDPLRTVTKFKHESNRTGIWCHANTDTRLQWKNGWIATAVHFEPRKFQKVMILKLKKLHNSLCFVEFLPIVNSGLL